MNCRPGDLAIVTRSLIASNVGKIVQVIKPFAVGDSHIIPLDNAGMIWLCDTAGSPLHWADAMGIGREASTSGPIPDACLRPIRPEPEHDQVREPLDAPLVA